jgi:hypothetical protein
MRSAHWQGSVPLGADLTPLPADSLDAQADGQGSGGVALPVVPDFKAPMVGHRQDSSARTTVPSRGSILRFQANTANGAELGGYARKWLNPRERYFWIFGTEILTSHSV